MNAITLLKQEHQKLRKKLTHIQNILQQHNDKKILFSELCKDIIKHERMKHAIWYPYFKNEVYVDHSVSHLIMEKKYGENVVNTFNQITNEEKWNKMFLKFKKELDNHVNEEEEKIFPKINNLFSPEKLEEIGKRMIQFYNNSSHHN